MMLVHYLTVPTTDINQISPQTLSLSLCVSAPPSNAEIGTSQKDTIGAMDPQATHLTTHTQKGNAETVLKDVTNTAYHSVSEDSPVHISTSDALQLRSSSNGGVSSSSSASTPNLKQSHIVIEMEPSQTGNQDIIGSITCESYRLILLCMNLMNSKTEAAKTREGRQEKRIERYKHLSSLISTRILAKRTLLDAQIRDLEHQHFITHGRVPDHDESYAHSISVRNSVKAESCAGLYLYISYTWNYTYTSMHLIIQNIHIIIILYNIVNFCI